MTARFLQLFRPDDIVFLVKSGFQLHKHGNLFPVFRRLLQGRNDGRIAAYPIKGLLDGQHLRIPGRLSDKPYHRLEALVRMMHQDIPLPDLLKHIRVLRQLRHNLGRQITVLLQMVKTFHTVEFHQKSQIQRSADGIDILLRNCQFLPDQSEEAAVNALLHLQTDHLSPLSLFELLLDLLQEILRLLLLNRQIRIPHDAERIGADNIIVQKQLVYVALDHFFQKDQLPALLRRNFHQTGKDAWHLHRGKLQLPVSVFLRHQSPQI